MPGGSRDPTPMMFSCLTLMIVDVSERWSIGVNRQGGSAMHWGELVVVSQAIESDEMCGSSDYGIVLYCMMRFWTR